METGFITKKLRAECDIGPRGDEWRLTEPLVACWRGKRIEILPGYSTDGASIPKPAWSIIGHPWDYYLPAAVAHDALCAAEIWPRSQTDLCFHDLMHVLSVRVVRLHTMYYFVRVYATLFSWRGHSEEVIANAREHLIITNRCVDPALETVQ